MAAMAVGCRLHGALGLESFADEVEYDEGEAHPFVHFFTGFSYSLDITAPPKMAFHSFHFIIILELHLVIIDYFPGSPVNDDTN